MTDTLPPQSEASFMRQVQEVAHVLRWAVYHVQLSKWGEKGWPDLVLARPPRLVFAELKSERGKVTEFQRRWLDLLRACPPAEVYIWRPSDWDALVEILR